MSSSYFYLQRNLLKTKENTPWSPPIAGSWFRLAQKWYKAEGLSVRSRIFRTKWSSGAERSSTEIKYRKIGHSYVCHQCGWYVTIEEEGCRGLEEFSSPYLYPNAPSHLLVVPSFCQPRIGDHCNLRDRLEFSKSSRNERLCGKLGKFFWRILIKVFSTLFINQTWVFGFRIILNKKVTHKLENKV